MARPLDKMQSFYELIKERMAGAAKPMPEQFLETTKEMLKNKTPLGEWDDSLTAEEVAGILHEMMIWVQSVRNNENTPPMVKYHALELTGVLMKLVEDSAVRYMVENASRPSL